MNLSILFVIYIATILVARVPLLFWHKHAPKVAGLQLHHYMYGLILIAIYFFIPQPVLLAIGLGLFVDELPLFFIFRGWDWPDDHWKQYHSEKTIWGIITVSIAGFLVLYLL